MSLQPKTESVQSGKVIWQKVLETVRGGFGFDATGITGVIQGGAPVRYNEATRTAQILKLAEIYENGTGTSFKVKKGHNLAVGNHVGKTVGGAAYTITAIVTTDPLFDTITTGTTLGSHVAGESVFQSSAAGASAAALNVVPNGMLYDDIEVGKDDFLSVVSRGTLYERRVNAVPTVVKTALVHIIFSQSF